MKEMYAFIFEMILGLSILIIYAKSCKARNIILKIENVMSRIQVMYVPLLIFMAFMLSLGFINGGHDWGGDFSQYIAQSQALINGTVKEQAEIGKYISDNSVVGLCPDVYPWGYSFIILPVYIIFGMNFKILKMVGAIYFIVFQIVFFEFCKKRFQPLTAFLLTLLFTFNQGYLTIVDSVISDMPFLFFSIMGIFAFYKILTQEKKQILWASICGLMTFGAYFCRANGIVSILTIICIDLLFVVRKLSPFVDDKIKNTGIKRQKVSCHLIIYIVFFIGKFLIDSFLPKAGSGYSTLIDEMSIYSILNNIKAYYFAIAEFFKMGDYFGLVVMPIFLILFFIGVLDQFWNELPMIVYVFGMLGLLIIYPGFQGMRYAFTVIPFAVVLATQGLRKLIGMVKKIDRYQLVVSARLITACCCACMLAFSLRMIVICHITKTYTTNQAYTLEAQETYEYIKQNTNEEDIIIFCKPRVLWLNTGRLGFSISDNADDLERGDYILLLKDDHLDSVKSEVEKNSNKYQLEFDNHEFQLYKINKGE